MFTTVVLCMNGSLFFTLRNNISHGINIQMELNFTVSGRTVKLKYINLMEIYYTTTYHYDIENENGLLDN